LLIICSALFACKKDKGSTPLTVTSDLVKGIWEMTSIKTEYYDEESNKVHEDNTVPPPERTVEFRGDKTFRLTYEGTYALSTAAGKEYLKMYYSGDSLVFEIKEISETDLILSNETSPDGYYENDSLKFASKSISTVSFIKRQ
jgi:hypothetical protein